MPKIERNIEINASSKKVWEVLTDLEHFPKWNISIKEINELESNKYFIKSTMGDYTSTNIERIENKKTTSKADHPEFTEYGFILNEKADITELSYWVDVPKITREKIQARSLEITLRNIKNFVEYLEDGGDPDEYDRKHILVQP
ncbi:MAG: SRPBCC family protein [Candidatus Hermodarchaeota archaeon]